ncbi:MAG: hypothetical protein ACI4WT_00420 [Oligosphaeraceae bacterium]
MTTRHPLPMRLFALLVLPLLLTGCLHFRQTITLHANGGMTVSLVYSVPEDQMPALTAAHDAIAGWQRQDARTPNWFMDETAVRTFFTQPDEGLKLLLYRKYVRSGRQTAEIIVEAKDARRACANGYFGNLTLDGRTLTIQLSDTPDALPKADIQRLRDLCDDLTLEIEVLAPANIRETNGYRRDRRRAYWLFSADGRGIDLFGKLPSPTLSW